MCNAYRKLDNERAMMLSLVLYTSRKRLKFVTSIRLDSENSGGNVQSFTGSSRRKAFTSQLGDSCFACSGSVLCNKRASDLAPRVGWCRSRCLLI